MAVVPESFEDVVQIARRRATGQPETRAFTFLEFAPEPRAPTLTYAELDLRARAAAVHVQSHARAGDRALVLFQPGLDFISGFLACLYAGIIAVPVPVPRHRRGAERMRAIVEDADATVTLSTSSVRRAMEDLATPCEQRWLCLDELDTTVASRWSEPVVSPSDLAFLQYTSGSTGRPKGTMISHGNVMHQSRAFHRASGATPDSCLVSWVPTFHDLGLVAGVLQPMYAGYPAVLMAPAAFVESPDRWLKAISDYQADMTISPNFGYELAAAKIPPELLRTFDLRRLRFAVTGAEHVKARTLEAFADRFATCGFRAASYFPAWGLAEATLMVTGASHPEGPLQGCFDVHALEENRIVPWSRRDRSTRTLVSCGVPAAGFELAVVDPETGRRVESSRVGEVWVSSPSVARGYWHRPDETLETFEARISTSGDGPYLRTGDLGFVHEGELFICGRLKDLIIVRGGNHHAPDIEVTVEECHPAFRRSFGAAFAIQTGDEERLVVAQEIDRDSEPSHARALDEMFETIRRAIAEEHEIQVHAIVLLKHGTIPKTSSGKIQRRECRARYLNGRLSVHAAWISPGPGDERRSPWSPKAEPAERAAPMLESKSHSAVATKEPIALVGIGCRFPGARGPREFWNLLCEGRDAITEVPAQRWNIDEVYDPDPLAAGKMNTRHGGFLDNIDLLDAKFFELSAREAARMDPQHRLLLEVAWEALEDAGAVAGAFAGASVGVFVGISLSDYGHLQFNDLALADAYAGIGAALTMAASRISYFLNLRGPAMAVDTACSSSLTAVHLACSSIWRGECTAALAGGVNVILSPAVTMCLTKAGMLAPDGRCKAFDARANGYVRSEGAGIVLLKPLSRARADGDPIYAIVRGSASNQDGRSNGITAPSGGAQQQVILAACRDAGVSPGDLDYVEAHGTGTPVGDPIELNALGAVLGIGRTPGAFCAVGSVKTNIGHSESAAGIASVIKTALMLKHRRVPPSLHFEHPNPGIAFDRLPIRLQTTLGLLPERSRPALAGVNGFGVGGTNVHVILEEAPRPLQRSQGNDARGLLLALSARSDRSLDANARLMVDLLRNPETADTARDVCYTAGARRSHLEHRLAVTGSTAEDLANALARHLDSGHDSNVAPGLCGGSHSGLPRMAFVYAGQGSQWPGMGRRLFEEEPVFRRTIEECDASLCAKTGRSLIDELMADEPRSRLQETVVAQPALFALQMALTRLCQSWGITPDAVIGHSVGEVAAACVAGALSLDDAIGLVAQRGELMQSATGRGSMASVESSVEEIEPMLARFGDRLSIAAVNAPRSVVLSGDAIALAQVLEHLEHRGIPNRLLPVRYAFHCRQMDPFAERLASALVGLQPAPVRIPMYSTVLGAWCDRGTLDAEYWAANIRQPVMFGPAIEALARDGILLFTEIGPHPVLCGAIQRVLTSIRVRGVAVPSLRRDLDGRGPLLATLGALYAHGRAPDWTALYPHAAVCQTLPTYQWDRQRFWIDARQPAVASHPVDPVLGTRVPGAQLVWQRRLDPEAIPALKAFRLDGGPRLPSSVLVEMSLAAAAEVFGEGSTLEDLTFHDIAELPPERAGSLVQVTATADPASDTVIRAFVGAAGNGPGNWTLHLRARAMPGASEPPPVVSPLRPYDIQRGAQQMLDGVELYRELAESGTDYGAALQAASGAWRSADAALLHVDVPRNADVEVRGRGVDCVLLEAACQAARLAHGTARGRLDLARIQRVHVRDGWNGGGWVYARLRPALEGNEDTARADVTIASESGDPVAMVEGIQFDRRCAKPLLRVTQEPQEWLCRTVWQRAPLTPPPMEAWGGPATWIVLADRRGTGEALAARLAERGEACILVRPGDTFEQVSPDSFVVSPANAADFARLMAHVTPGGFACIVHMWSLDATSIDCTTAESIDLDQALGGVSVLSVIQAAASCAKPPRLWLVTEAAQPVSNAAAPASASASMLWGLGKVIVQEHPELRCRRVDLGSERTPEELQGLIDECLSSSPEDQVAFRGADRYVARLLPLRADVDDGVPDDLRPFRHRLPPVVERFDARLPRMWRQAPAAGEVEIRVLAAGANVCSDSGPAAQGHGDYAGSIVRAGPGVTDLAVGDDVVALSSGPTAPYVTVPASSVVRRPPMLAVEEAAAETRAFLTAFHAVHDLAAVAESERVLVHGASTSVGLAAVQVARSSGAIVIATAADEEDRDRLSSLGVWRIVEANSLAAPSEVLALTGGRGVDAIVNCLPGWRPSDYLPLLAAGGRCVDTAPAGSVAHVLEAARGVENLSLHTVSIAELQRQRPAYVRSRLSAVMEQFAGRQLVPIPARDRRSISPPELEDAELRPFVRDDGTYLITGGLGGLGLAVADRMVRRGARHLCLVSRRPPSPAARQALARFRDRGVHVSVHSIDVADGDQMRELLGGIRRSRSPLRGIVHAAGVLDNGLLVQMDERRFRAAMPAKVSGAWHLHTLTTDLPLDFFVLFSSLAALIGSPGQGNYAAANAFLDGLALFRRSRKLPALSIAWGPWTDIGMAALAHNERRLAELGIGMLPPEPALDLFEHLARDEQGVVGAIAMDWRIWSQMFPAAAQAPFVSRIIPASDPAETAATDVLTAAALGRLDPAAKIARLEERLQAAACQALQLDAAQLPLDISLAAVGIDSIVALELRNRIESTVDVIVQTSSLLSGPTIHALAVQLLAQIESGAADHVNDRPPEGAAMLLSPGASQ